MLQEPGSCRSLGQKAPFSCSVSPASLLTKLNIVPVTKRKIFEGYRSIFEEQAMQYKFGAKAQQIDNWHRF